jgi:Leucine Rich repeats (2 copies)
MQNNNNSIGFKTDGEAVVWYDALPENLRDAIQINLQLQAAGKTTAAVENEKKHYGMSIDGLKAELLPADCPEVRVNAKCLNEMPYFYLFYSEKCEVSPLQYLTNLQLLDLGNATNLSDISPLRGLTNLQTLNLSWCTNLSDISPLQYLTNLQTLNLNFCKNLSDISPLCNLMNLQTLDLIGCDNLSDISSLRGLTNLQTLDL